MSKDKKLKEVLRKVVRNDGQLEQLVHIENEFIDTDRQDDVIDAFCSDTDTYIHYWVNVIGADIMDRLDEYVGRMSEEMKDKIISELSD